MFYSELKGTPDFSSWTLEQKFIFTKYFNNINLSFNPVLEYENEKIDGKWHREFEIEFVGGVSFIREYYSYGFECKLSEYANYLGPVLLMVMKINGGQ